MKSTAIILSAGKGTRMNSDVSKQYIPINGKPLLYYSLYAFERSLVDEMIVVVGENDIEYVQHEIVEKYEITKAKMVIAGGKERYESSYKGILAAEGADYVLIHDAARPCITIEKINELVEEVSRWKACILAVPVKDTIKISDSKNKVKMTPDRNFLWQVQTPQAFDRNILIAAYEEMMCKGDKTMTDDSMVIEKYSDEKVQILQGEYTNIKATTPEDMRVLANVIK